MARPTTLRFWLLWLAGTLALAGAGAYLLFAGPDKTLLMPGDLSPGHHQLAGACDACHTTGFGGDEVLQEACVACHGDVRRKPFDSHPRAKFTDPRNADRLERINALVCVSCHMEHRPEITSKNGLTQPRDVCFHCHAEVGEDRPSHEGMAMDSCTSSGCHNFHDNRALYTEFLVKHMDDPATRERPRVPLRTFSEVVEEIMDYPRDHYPLTPVDAAAMDAPATVAVAEEVMAEWEATAHARAGVNCSACHQPRDAEGEPASWQERPGPAGCAACHGLEQERFGKGKHGMRLAAGLSAMTPAAARLPMQPDAGHETLDCVSCHGAHTFDPVTAAVEACLGCHADDHSLAYEGSPHQHLWQAEVTGEGPAGSGVSCATCHMPRVDFDVNDWMSRTLVDHNQSANLSPNSKMIRPACLHCHGLGFAIDSLADEALIRRNFTGRPAVEVQSIGLARADQERYLREMEAARE